jgi:hypothetical protein
MASAMRAAKPAGAPAGLGGSAAGWDRVGFGEAFGFFIVPAS